jgi:predicted ester cyclase
VKRISIVCVALALSALVSSARAEDGVPQSIALFYDALTASPGKDVAGLLRQATSQDWVSCGGNQACGAREQVITAIARRHQAIPDLKWEIKEVVVSGNRVVVRGEATGTPAGDFLGVPHSGKAFRIMSIDVHTMNGARIWRSYHVEDWIGATRQLAAP